VREGVRYIDIRRGTAVMKKLGQRCLRGHGLKYAGIG